MTRHVYDWNRYWVPRDGAFSFDEDGFLLAPSTDRAWRRVQRTDAVEFSEIADKRCLVLLGEPGIGKTFALKRAKRQTSFLLNLGSYGSEERLINDLFRSDEFRNWAKHGGDFEVFIDSFDECLLRLDNVAAALSKQGLRPFTTKRFSFPIGSRSGEHTAGTQSPANSR